MVHVSVLMPCYNAAATLEDTLESLAHQSYKDFEVVAVDDGSTDGTGEILMAWTKNDDRVRALRRDHEGIISSLNAGLEACVGDYVARMDADDLAHPQRLEMQAEFLDQRPHVGLVGCLVDGFPKGNVREGFRIYLEWLNSLLSDEDIKRELFVESPLAHPSVMFRREVVVRAGAYQEHGWPEDYDLWLRLAQAGVQMVKVPRLLLSWRDHPERLTRVDSRYSLENFLRAKAYYLVRGPLSGRDAVFIWGAGMMGRRLSKHLLREGAPIEVFIDVDRKKIGSTRRGKAIISPDELMEWWRRYEAPILLAAVGARGARKLIRERLFSMGFREGEDWLAVA